MKQQSLYGSIMLIEILMDRLHVLRVETFRNTFYQLFDRDGCKGSRAG